MAASTNVHKESANVCVVIPCYRCAGTIRRAVESVHSQTMRPAKVILVDDCSGDCTLAILNELKESYVENWIEVISLPCNAGPATARNAGWNRSNEPYVAFLDADDSWHPLKIEIQYLWMISRPEVTLTGHAYRVVDRSSESDSQIRRNQAKTVFSKISANQLLISNRISTPTVMLRRDIEFRFREGGRHSEDYLLWLQICLSGEPCFRSDRILTNLHKAAYGESGLSAELWEMEKGELYTYTRLHRDGFIGLANYVVLLVLSIIKYAGRVVRTTVRASNSEGE